jgi:hypothetical protein
MSLAAAIKALATLGAVAIKDHPTWMKPSKSYSSSSRACLVAVAVAVTAKGLRKAGCLVD